MVAAMILFCLPSSRFVPTTYRKLEWRFSWLASVLFQFIIIHLRLEGVNVAIVKSSSHDCAEKIPPPRLIPINFKRHAIRCAGNRAREIAEIFSGDAGNSRR